MKTLRLLLPALLFWVSFSIAIPVVYAAPSFDAGACTTDTSTGGTVSVTYTVGAGQDIGVALFRTNSQVPLDAITWGGSGMTQLSPAATTTGSVVYQAYYFPNPPSGSTTITIDMAGGQGGGTLCAGSFAGVDSSDPLDAVAIGGSNAGTSWTQAITVTDDAMVIGAHYQGGVEAVPTGNNGTSVGASDITPGGSGTSAFLYKGPISPAGSTTAGLDYSSDTNEHVVLALKTESPPAPPSTGVFSDGAFNLTVTPQNSALVTYTIPGPVGCPDPSNPNFFLELQGNVFQNNGLQSAQTVFTFATTSASLPHTFEQNLSLPAGDYYWVYLHCASLNLAGEVDWPGGNIALVPPINASGTTQYAIPFTIAGGGPTALYSSFGNGDKYALTSGYYTGRNGAGVHNAVWTFTPTTNQTFDAIKLYVQELGATTWSTTLTVNVDGSDVASGSLSENNLSGSAEYIEIPLSGEVAVEAGQLITFTFSGPTGAGDRGFWEQIVFQDDPSTGSFTDCHGACDPPDGQMGFELLSDNPSVEDTITVLPYATSSAAFQDTASLCDHLGATSTFSFLGTDFGFWFPTGGGVVDCVIDITRYLFVPGQTTLGRLSDARTVLQSKAPFGYASVVASSTEAIFEDPGTSSTQVSLTIPAGTMNNHTTQTLALFNTATVQANVEPLISPIRVVLSILLWAGFLFALYEFAVHHQKP